jgi:hypothetical protein
MHQIEERERERERSLFAFNYHRTHVDLLGRSCDQTLGLSRRLRIVLLVRSKRLPRSLPVRPNPHGLLILASCD